MPVPPHAKIVSLEIGEEKGHLVLVMTLADGNAYVAEADGLNSAELQLRAEGLRRGMALAGELQRNLAPDEADCLAEGISQGLRMVARGLVYTPKS